jgi:MFS family permease
MISVPDIMANMPAIAPRGTYLLLVNNTLNAVPLGFQMVVMPLYLARSGFDPASIGLLYLVSGLLSAAMVIVAGVIADRFGRARLLTIGTALLVPSYAILATTTEPVWVALATVLTAGGFANGIAGALVVGSFDALLAERTGGAERTRVFAAAQALMKCGLAAGAALAVVPEILRASGSSTFEAYRPLFLAAVVILVIATGVVLRLRDGTGARSTSSWLPRRSLRPIVIYSAVTGLIGFAFGVAVQLLPLWLHVRFGATEADLGPWYAGGQILSIGSVVMVRWLDHRFGAVRSVAALQLVAASTLVLMVLAPGLTQAAALIVLRSFVTTCTWPFLQSLLMSAVDPSERAAAAGIGYGAWGLLNALGPAVAGLMLAGGVLALPVLLGAVVYTIAALVAGFGFATIGRIDVAPSARPGVETAAST